MDGLEKLQRQLILMEAALMAGAEDGAHKAAEHILGVSNEHIPHEEGTLERDGRVHVHPPDRDGARATIGYGGGNSVTVSGTGEQSVGPAAYVVVQHEDMTLKHDPGRNAKFLENAHNGERATAQKIIATSMETMLERAARRR